MDELPSVETFEGDFYFRFLSIQKLDPMESENNGARRYVSLG